MKTNQPDSDELEETIELVNLDDNEFLPLDFNDDGEPLDGRFEDFEEELNNAIDREVETDESS